MDKNNNKSCFVISPIGNLGSLERTQADLIFEYVIEPAIEKAGYQKPIRMDFDYQPSMITNTIIQHLVKDDLVVAVLTGKNPNVFYELSIRHAIMKPCVHLIDEGSWPPPFDVSGMNMIKYNLLDWNSPKKAIEELIKAIKSIEKSKIIINPISSALAVQKSIISEDANTKNIAIVMEQVQQALNEIRQVQSNIQRYSNYSNSNLSLGSSVQLGSSSYNPSGPTINPYYLNTNNYEPFMSDKSAPLHLDTSAFEEKP